MKYLLSVACLFVSVLSFAQDSGERVFHGPLLTVVGPLSPFEVKSNSDGSLAVSVNTTDLVKLVSLFERLGDVRTRQEIAVIQNAVNSKKATVHKSSASEFDYSLEAKFDGTCRTMACDDAYEVSVERKYIGNGTDYEVTIELGQALGGCDGDYLRFIGTSTHTDPETVYKFTPKSVKLIKQRKCS